MSAPQHAAREVRPRPPQAPEDDGAGGGGPGMRAPQHAAREVGPRPPQASEGDGAGGGGDCVARLRNELDRICAAASELDAYRTEPRQMPSGVVGKYGYLRLGFRKEADGRSVLYDIDRRVPFLVQKGLYWDEGMPHMPCVFIITTTGCLLQGDRMALEIRVGENAVGHVATQSATRVHMMDANYAAQLQSIIVEPGGYLEYMPDPLIPHRTSRFLSDTAVSIAESGSLIYSEVLLPGRKYHHEDERFGFDLYSSHIHAVRRETGEKLFAEKCLLEPRVSDVLQTGVMNGFDVFGVVVLLTQPDKARRVRDCIGADVDLQGRLAYGATVLPGECGLSFKVLGDASETVRAKIRQFWSVARETITGCPLPEEFLWR